MPVSMLKRSALFLSLLFPVLISGCAKNGNNIYQAGLQLFIDARQDEIQWAEVSCDRLSDGHVTMDAWGNNDERFLLSLNNITDTGFITTFDISNISYQETQFFKSAAIQSGSIRIDKNSAREVKGTLDVTFFSASGSTFRVHGTF